MRLIRRRCTAAAALLALAATAPAFAAGAWMPPVDGGEIITPYAAVYAGKTHHGVDIAGAAGESVAAPASGQVVFAGRVPADGGGTCGAVTIELAEGLRVSYVPLAEVLVGQGGQVEAGEIVGTLAASGDDSSAEAHLHLGLRRGDEYLDPTALLPAASAGVAGPAAELPADPGSGESGGTTVPSGAPAASGAPAVAAGPSLATVRVPSGNAAVSEVAVSSLPAAVAAPVRHLVPEGSGVPAPSEIVRLQATSASLLRLPAASVVGQPQAAPITVLVVSLALVIAGTFGLTRQFAHGRAC